ncbi:phage portal protein [Pseudonocardia sp. WMMC193]|uniref:phage portal protein n=1 Tax=Pseudonocardia sp. WMMC193 TaxID=2911965 RepID=UPI001F182CB8|nr:phage portal protein [Pseudonocardia sp. WMMC193]MCF7550979.1 phage portal protein [Pseudonocardia sp. WMMC193]
MIFQTLGELSSHLESRPGLTVVDPGVPLYDVANHRAAQVWRTQPSVRKVVDFAARGVASIPLHLHERVDDNDRAQVNDHVLARTMRQPRRRLAPFRFWHSVLVDWMTFDKMAIFKVPGEDGELSLVRVPARRVRFEGDGVDDVTAIRVAMSDGRWYEFDPDEMIYDAGYSVRGVNGTSPMETLADILGESTEAVAYRRTVWKNGARVPVIVERPADAPDWSGEGGGKDRFIAGLRNYTRGGGAEGGWPIFEDGMTAKPIEAFKPRDTGDLEGRKLSDAEVASAFHIPPELVGAREGTFSNIDAFRQMLYGDALGPWITLRDQLLNVQLVPDYDQGRPLYVEGNVEAKMRGSFREEAQVLQSSVGAPYMTRNEARARRNLPAVDGGDALVTPLNVIVGGLASPNDTGSQNAGPKNAPSGSGSPPTGTGRGTHGKADDEETAGPPEDLADPDAELAVFTDDLGAFFDRQSRSVTSALGAEKARRSREELAHGAEFRKAGEVDAVWDAERWDRELAAVISPRIMRLAEAGAWAVLALYNPEAEGWDAEVMTAWLLAAAASHAESINSATKARLEEAVADEDDWKTRVADAFGHLATNAGLFALSMRTEALGFGGHDAAGASGLTHKTWETTSTNPRSEHKRLDGETVPMADTFSNGARWPGDSVNLDVDDRANCKCIVKFHVEGE